LSLVGVGGVTILDDAELVFGCAATVPNIEKKKETNEE
jgi:hypothetical protein